MNRKRDDLNQLVHALTKGEKRYFSKVYERELSGMERPLFLQLYLSHEKGKDDLDKFFNRDSPQALTLTNRMLYGNILKALRALHDDISADTLIQNQLSEVEILYNHNLPDQALLVLRRAHGLAVRHEKFGLLLQTLE